MIGRPAPLILKPIFKPKPWGGRSLERLFGKSLPASVSIGESWEVSGLPGNESIVRDGPYAGRSLHELAAMWGRDLLGDVAPVEGRFPLLVKFLDARETLSVQVHPRPLPNLGDQTPGIKHEAWYVLAADDGAEILAGLAEGVDADRLRRDARSSAIANCLRRWPVVPGECFYLPSGTLHALGAGVVVAEVQTPSDVTYRMHDWGRVDAAGNLRELHVDRALENTRFDIHVNEIRQSPAACADIAGAERVCACERFTIDREVLVPQQAISLAPREMQIILPLTESLEILHGTGGSNLSAGDAGVVPASCAAEVSLRSDEPCVVLIVRGGGA